MPKRFHDTEIWNEDWYLEMPIEYMKLWDYIKDTCDHAGIWRPNKKRFELLIKRYIDLRIALKYFNAEKERVKILPNGRWFILDFIAFQYGSYLNSNNRVHNSIIRLLEVNGINLTSIRGLNGVKDSLKDKDKDKDKDFNKLWLLYPRCVNKKEALRHFRASVKTDKDLTDIKKALVNYKKSVEGKDIKYIQHGSKWFNNWRDWVNYRETPQCSKCDGTGTVRDGKDRSYCSCAVGAEKKKKDANTLRR